MLTDYSCTTKGSPNSTQANMKGTLAKQNKTKNTDNYAQ